MASDGSMTAETRALNAVEAERLRTDPAFQRAVVAIRKNALEALVMVDPSDQEAIRTNQAMIKAIDNLCQEIANEIIRGAHQGRVLSVA